MDDLFLFDTQIETPWEEKILENLNPEQKEAVCHNEGPLLILAGAGSGKTRVITFRIAYLIRVRRVRPSSILAITFTNKAANEMKERIRDLVGDMASYMWVGTFHAMFARILRRHAEMIGFSKNFSILDTDDQQKIIKECISQQNLNDKIFAPRSVAAEISKAKNELMSPSDMEKDAGSDFRRQKIAVLYRMYADKLRAANAMDFDDILYYAVGLFAAHPDVLTYYQEQFRYLLVDEYQDTNQAQYRLILMLAKRYRNLCVVGDDDQSIYSFRGANIRNILDFEKDFRDTKVIKLEQNYRSTENILQAANSLIRRNVSRKKKTLRTEIGPGDKITWYSADHHGAEAYFVADQIQRMVATKQFAFRDIAVLYRMNALSRSVESALREQGIPYRVYGGQRFYDRKEIKDILAYLRLIMSPEDAYAFDRVINVPKRGIGDTTVDKIREIAGRTNKGFLAICEDAYSHPELARAASKLSDFYSLIQSLREKVDENQMSFSEFIEYVQDKTGMMQEIIEQKEKKGETIDRVENLKELLSEAVEFEARRRGAADQIKDLAEENGREALLDDYSDMDTAYAADLAGILQAYLENAALYSDGDEDDANDDFVKLLTIHSAKGLEFGSVFIVGAEEGLFPGMRSMDSNDAIEEERRLMYVAITRAKKKLYIISSRSRIIFGQTTQMPPSRFIREIDPTYIEAIGAMRQTYSDASAGPERGAASRTPDGRPVPASGYAPGARTDAFNFAGSSRPSGIAPAAFAGAVKPAAGNTASDGTSYLTPESVEKGMEVRHPRFGKGTVVTVERIAGDALVCVCFENKSTKNMLVRQAKLTRA